MSAVPPSNGPVGTVNLEIQLLRDWNPRSRPTRGKVIIGSGEPYPQLLLLSPGAAAVGTEQMMAHLESVTRVSPEWVTARVALTIDGTNIGDPRPTMFWIGGYSDFPTAITHYPVVAGYDSLMYRGKHTLLFRVVQ